MFENRVSRRIFGPRRDEVTRKWRTLHNEELKDLYSSPNIFRVINSRRMRWAGHVARMGKTRGVYRFLVVKPGGKRRLGRSRQRWENGSSGSGLWGMDWIELAQDRKRWRELVNSMMNLRVP